MPRRSILKSALSRVFYNLLKLCWREALGANQYPFHKSKNTLLVPLNFRFYSVGGGLFGVTNVCVAPTINVPTTL